MTEQPLSDAAQSNSPDLGRRRLVLRLGLAAAAAYVAPMVLRIADEAEAKGPTKRRRGPTKRRGPTRRRGPTKHRRY